jgi:hypothetical protein
MPDKLPQAHDLWFFAVSRLVGGLELFRRVVEGCDVPGLFVPYQSNII